MPVTRNRYDSAVAAFARGCALWYSDDASVASFTGSRATRNCDNSAIAAFSGRSTRRHRNHTAIAPFAVQWNAFVLSRTELALHKVANWTRIQGAVFVHYEIEGARPGRLRLRAGSAGRGGGRGLARVRGRYDGHLPRRPPGGRPPAVLRIRRAARSCRRVVGWQACLPRMRWPRRTGPRCWPDARQGRRSTAGRRCARASASAARRSAPPFPSTDWKRRRR